jgi:hypothetical protein
VDFRGAERMGKRQDQDKYTTGINTVEQALHGSKNKTNNNRRQIKTSQRKKNTTVSYL